MKGRPLTIAALSCFVVFIITGTTYWWRTADNNGDHRSISSLLAPLAPACPTVTATSSSKSAASGDLFQIDKKVAAIVETRPVRTLIPLILHFASVLGPDWPILFFTRASTLSALSAFGHSSIPFKRMVASGQIKIIELPTEPWLGNYLGISHFLASKWFWDKMESAEYMLNFQTDSILCANSGRQVEDYFDYDFIGAYHPWVPGAYNGGLSLRNVALARKVVSMYNISDDVAEGTKDGWYEDVWFCNKMKGLGGRFPTLEVASEFSVDLIWAERPLGFHGINKTVQIDREAQIYEWCPEAALGAGSGELVQLNEDEKNSWPLVEDGVTEGGKHLPFPFGKDT
jgi:hypothetical protein